jgi:uncharacterized membrane protein YqgA involved in biofilm formation
MNETKTQFLIITEWITILGTLIGCFFFVNSQIQQQASRIDQQAARTDRLYEMFIDLLKDVNK